MGFIRKVASVCSRGLVASRSDKEDRVREAAVATWRAQQAAVDVHRYTLLIEERLR